MSVVLCETHLETNVNAGAHQQKLEHEVVNGLHEELAVGCADRGVLLVSSEVLYALF